MAVVSGEQSCGSAGNVPMNLGLELDSVTRSGNNVTVRVRAYCYQTTSTWSSNSWVIWLNGSSYFVHTSSGGNKTSKGVKMYTPWVNITVYSPGTSCSITVGVNGNWWNPTNRGPAGNFTFTISGYQEAYTPVAPNLNISVSAPNITTVTISRTGQTITDLSSYTYTFRLYSDSGRSHQVWSKTGSNINDFPFSWTGADPDTTYYWSLNFSGVNSHTGGTLSMSQKTGSVRTPRPQINTESFNFTASPLYNGHWTPRTVVSYSFSSSTSGDYSSGLTFVGYDIETALNGLNSNTKRIRTTSTSGTISLTDLTKLVRAVKPRDLFYLKVRVVCRASNGREYYSDWFGITTAQYIYNWYHLYVCRPGGSDELRINSRVQFSGNGTEKYWNKGEVVR